jgi:adenine-specific DNA-methyltransferase
MPESPDFSLQPYEGREKPPAPQRLIEEGEDAEVPYPGAPIESGAAEPARRKKRNTARLVWDSKPKRAPNPKNLGFQIAEIVVPNPATQAGLRLPFDPGTQDVDTSNCNRVIWGDNLLVMQALLAQGYEGKINLIYIDPPFDSKADYSHSVYLSPDDSGGGGGELDAEMSALERLAYRDTWEEGTDSYLDMLYPRLQLMKRLLADDGSIFLHCDWHVGHYIKIMLDEVFGRNLFVNEIVWYYYNKMQGNIDHFASNHDTIFWYKNSSNHIFNKIRESRGETVKQIKRVWDKDKQALVNAKGPDGKVIYIETDERTIDNVWRLSMLQPADKSENINYQTQKPETVLERIVRAASKPNDLVADFFCGSGTTAAVAEKLGRRWITSDLGKASIQVARNRFVKMGEKGSGGIDFERTDGATRCAPFVVENLGNYQRQLIYLNDKRLKQIGPLVLTLFGAQPHPQERNLGSQAFNDPETGRYQNRLVLVGEPDRPLSAKRVAETVSLLNTLDGGGYSKLVALGWDFELNFDASLQHLLGANASKVEARIIPTDVIEHLKRIPDGAGPDDREVERLRAKVSFFEKPWLGEPVLHSLGWVEHGSGRLLRVKVSLTRYLLRNVPAGLKGTEKLSDAEKRSWLLLAGGPDGLGLIDFWCIDDDLGGEDGKRPFMNSWQDLRGLGKRVRRVMAETEILFSPRPGRKLGLRLVDVFGNDAAWSGLLPED